MASFYYGADHYGACQYGESAMAQVRLGAFRYGAFHYGAVPVALFRYDAFQYGAGPVRRISVWRSSSVALRNIVLNVPCRMRLVYVFFKESYVYVHVFYL